MHICVHTIGEQDPANQGQPACCSVLIRVLQRIVAYCSEISHSIVCTALEGIEPVKTMCVAGCCSVAVCCSVPQCAAVCCSVLQRVAEC